MAEFTGERVIPGQVDSDLWNEHFSRYLFASRLCRGKRVLDLGCGTGYGTSLLAESAALAVGVDISPQAAAYARANAPAGRAVFLAGSCCQVPLADCSFDLISAFEVIEHLDDWQALLREAKRLLAPGGQFLVSTPNKSYYAESRNLTGPNPFHRHEFELAEFQEALAAHFGAVTMFVQNHAETVVFQPLATNKGSVEVRIESGQTDPGAAHFFLAVCAASPQTGSPTFLYLPSTANILREREQHIARLEQELLQKNAWLEQSQAQHQTLLVQHRALQSELESRNQWAEKLNRELDESGRRVAQLQDELTAEQKSHQDAASAYEAKIADLERDNAAKAQWAIDTETRLSADLQAKAEELARCVGLLDQAEKTVEERTRWAQQIEADRLHLEEQLAAVQGSRWYLLGRRMGLGPQLNRPS